MICFLMFPPYPRTKLRPGCAKLAGSQTFRCIGRYLMTFVKQSCNRPPCFNKKGPAVQPPLSFTSHQWIWTPKVKEDQRHSRWHTVFHIEDSPHPTWTRFLQSSGAQPCWKFPAAVPRCQAMPNSNIDLFPSFPSFPSFLFTRAPPKPTPLEGGENEQLTGHLLRESKFGKSWARNRNNETYWNILKQHLMTFWELGWTWINSRMKPDH